MKILYDLKATQPNTSGAAHGGGKYAIAVFFELLNKKANLECFYDSRKPLREDVADAVEYHKIKLHDLSVNTLDEIAANGHFDIYYSAEVNWKRKLPSGILKICTLHGLREFEMPRDWGLLRYKDSAYKLVKTVVTTLFHNSWKKVLYKRYMKRLNDPEVRIVTVSNHTKYSCMAFFPHLQSKRLKVFYSPSSVLSGEASPYTNDYPYILLVSGNRSEKNPLRALMAIDEIFTEHPEFNSFRVLVTGTTGDSYRYKFHNPDNFTFLGYVPEKTLNDLYCGAYMFIYPSLNEGFGYPPLEAMRFGVPVVASANTSISEVCGDAALYCNPFDYKEIKGRILRLLDDKDCHTLCSERGLRRYNEVKVRQDADLSAFADYIMTGGEKNSEDTTT